MSKISKAFSKSNEIMREMNDLIKVPEMKEVMKSLAMEMGKAG